MKLFISWSGERSKQLAEALREWLPLVLHYVEPWVSNSDIEAGERWANEVGKELEASNFGVICITGENVGSPWILFEAGALSKSMQEGRVVPLLLDLDFKEISGPLAQFQSKKVEENGISDLVRAINAIAPNPVPEGRLGQLFSKLYSDLTEAVGAIPKAKAPDKPARPQQEVLEELVTGFRGLDGRLRELVEDAPSRRRRFGRLSPEMVYEAMNSVGAGPRDPVRFLVLGSFFRDDLPWLYELALEAHRTALDPNKRGAHEAERRLHRALESLVHGPTIDMMGSSRDGKDLRHLLMEARQMLRIFDVEPGEREDEKPQEVK